MVQCFGGRGDGLMIPFACRLAETEGSLALAEAVELPEA